MATVFGNINEMTIDQFNKSIEYYENKITDLNNDESLSPDALAYFLSIYKKRVKSLKKTIQKLESVIANARSAGIYVNDKTATFSSLGDLQTGPDNFATMAQNQTRHRRAQFFRILGMVLLPIVGTFPFLAAFRRARRKFRDVQNRILQENTDVKNFVHSEHRPYDNKLTTSEALTDEEIEQILSLPNEVARLENILTTATLSPAEKKHLTAKLVTIKTYAQENGITIAPTLLADSKFDTEKDKYNKTVNKIQTDAIAEVTFSPSALNIKQLHEKFNKLQAISERIVSALETDPENATLLAVQTTINTSIENVKTEVQNQVNTHSSAIVADLNSKKATANTKDAYENSNTNLDSVYANVATIFGTNIEEAKVIARELGADDSAIEKINETYTALKEENNSKISEITTEDKNKTMFDTELANVQNFITKWSSTFISGTPTSAQIFMAGEDLIKTESSISTLESLVKYITDSSKISDFVSAKDDFNNLKSYINSAQQKQDLTVGDLANQKDRIDNYTFDPSKSYTELEVDLNIIKSAHDTLSSDESRKAYEKAGLITEWATTVATAKDTIKKIENKMFEHSNSWDDLKVEIDSITFLTSETDAELTVKQTRLNEIVNTLSSDEFKSAKPSEYFKYLQKAKNTLNQVNEELQIRKNADSYQKEIESKINELENKANELIDSLKDASTDSKLTKEQRAVIDSNRNIYSQLKVLSKAVNKLHSSMDALNLSTSNKQKVESLKDKIDAQLGEVKTYIP